MVVPFSDTLIKERCSSVFLSNTWPMILASDLFNSLACTADDESRDVYKRQAYDKILSFFVFLDSLQSNNLPTISEYITANEVNLCLHIQAFQECVHKMCIRDRSPAVWCPSHPPLAWVRRAERSVENLILHLIKQKYGNTYWRPRSRCDVGEQGRKQGTVYAVSYTHLSAIS